MGKLFDNNDNPIVERLSTEQFVEYYQTASVVSLEAVSDFLGSTKDSLLKLNAFVFDHSTDRAMLDATENRYETLSVVKRLHFSDVAKESVTIPERFDGYYSAYVKDLIDVSEEAIADTESLLNNIKMAISGFINEYSENGVLSVYGKVYSDASDKAIQQHTKKLSAYFKTSKATFKSKVSDVLRNLGEVEGLFNSATKLEGAVSLSKVEKIGKLAKEVSEMVDTLIEQNTKSGVLLRNSEAKKELVEMIHVGARAVEFTSYLYSNSLYFYTALKSLSTTIIAVGNR